MAELMIGLGLALLEEEQMKRPNPNPVSPILSSKGEGVQISRGKGGQKVFQLA